MANMTQMTLRNFDATQDLRRTCSDWSIAMSTSKQAAEKSVNLAPGLEPA